MGKPIKRMTRKQYSFCVTEAANYSNSDTYVSGMMAASIWDNANKIEIPTERQETLRRVYTAVIRTVPEIVCASGLTQTAFAERWCIPLCTVQDWCGGIRECPLYTRLMMQQCMDTFITLIE